MYVIVDSRTQQRAYIGAWLDYNTCQTKVEMLKRTYPDRAEHYEIQQIK